MEITTLTQLKDIIADNAASGKLTICKLHATWCQPCKNMQKWLQTQQIPENVCIVKVDVDDDEDIANHFAVRNIPCALKFDKSIEPIDKIVGFEPVKTAKFFGIS